MGKFKRVKNTSFVDKAGVFVPPQLKNTYAANGSHMTISLNRNDFLSSHRRGRRGNAEPRGRELPIFNLANGGCFFV